MLSDPSWNKGELGEGGRRDKRRGDFQTPKSAGPHRWGVAGGWDVYPHVLTRCNHGASRALSFPTLEPRNYYDLQRPHLTEDAKTHCLPRTHNRYHFR